MNESNLSLLENQIKKLNILANKNLREMYENDRWYSNDIFMWTLCIKCVLEKLSYIWFLLS
jgi:hypothetical protein